MREKEGVYVSESCRVRTSAIDGSLGGAVEYVPYPQHILIWTSPIQWNFLEHSLCIFWPANPMITA